MKLSFEPASGAVVKVGPRVNAAEENNERVLASLVLWIEHRPVA